MSRRRVAWLAVGLCALTTALGPGRAAAHAFPERSEPRVGAVVRVAPARVRIWFDGELEPAFSTLMVNDAAGHRVDQGDGHVDPQNRRLLQLRLPALIPGAYKVIWRVLAVDGHRTEGDYVFILKGPE